MKTNKSILLILFLSWISLTVCAQSFKTVTVLSPGGLQTVLGNDWDKIDSVIVKGMINKADFLTLYDCARLGKLTVINLADASVEGNRIPNYALYYPNTMYDYLNIRRIILPDNVTEIGKFSFGMMRLEQINFPASLKSFSEGSFKNCHWLNMDPLVIPEGITEIPWECFTSCQSFKKLVLPQSLKTLAGFSFWNTRMEEMNLPDGLETIGNSAFWGSGELKRVVIPESVVNLEIGAFAQNDSLKSINIPHGISEIPDLFLAYSMEIDSIIIPDNIIKIGKAAFQLNYDLGYIQFPKYLKSIGRYAFDSVDIIEAVLPETLDSIGYGAFECLFLLEKAYCMAKTPPTAELDPNNNYCGPFHWSGDNCILYVPKGSGDLYRSATGWQDFQQIVETDDFPSKCGITFATECNVSSSDGMILVDNLSNRSVDIIIYTINGSLVLQDQIAESASFKVPSGIYLVKIGNKTHKIRVK